MAASARAASASRSAASSWFDTSVAFCSARFCSVRSTTSAIQRKGTASTRLAATSTGTRWPRRWKYSLEKAREVPVDIIWAMISSSTGPHSSGVSSGHRRRPLSRSTWRWPSMARKASLACRMRSSAPWITPMELTSTRLASSSPSRVADGVDPEPVDGRRAGPGQVFEQAAVVGGEGPGRIEGEAQATDHDAVDDQGERRRGHRTLPGELGEALVATGRGLDEHGRARAHGFDDGQPVGHRHRREPGQHLLGVVVVGRDVDHPVGPQHHDEPVAGTELGAALFDDQAEHLLGVARSGDLVFQLLHPWEDRWVGVYGVLPAG